MKEVRHLHQRCTALPRLSLPTLLYICDDVGGGRGVSEASASALRSNPHMVPSFSGMMGSREVWWMTMRRERLQASLVKRCLL
ncbi:hypothetical protein BHE74_00014574 [Ensete ventricosum]|nr:hypothetical protein BHE74_00014574 [Ensete ventricosum]